jgi:8-oxo-dGTP pyrophosphatase MutT (NUDIX family)
LLYPQQDQLRVVLTKRPDRMKDHSGQISFPGGRQDEGETLTETALRETCEEVGVCTDGITVVGALTSIYIPPTDYEVHPFVGFIAQRPIYQPNPGEVDVVLEPTLTHLLDPATRKTEKRKFPQWPLPITIPYYDVDGYKVWGATAIMLSEFLERWRIVT